MIRANHRGVGSLSALSHPDIESKKGKTDEKARDAHDPP
jgi:hypothetical protein